MWEYKKTKINSINDLPNSEELVGFVYMITNLKTGKFYIGKKQVYSNRKTRISKKEKTAAGTRKIFKVVTKESNWLSYYGSSKELTEDIKKLGTKNFSREIIELCYTKKYLSYAEFEWQVKLNVLKVDSYNGNILGRWFVKDMINKK